MKKEKEPNFFKEMDPFIKPYKKRYILSVMLSMLSVLCELLSYAFVGILAGYIFKGFHGNNMIYVLIFTIICKISGVLLSNISTLISHKAAYLTLKDLRYAICDKFVRLPMGYFDMNPSGTLKTILVDRVEDIEKTLAHLLPEMTANLLIPIAMIVWMLAVNIKLTGIIFLWVIFGLSIGMLMMIGYKKKYEGQVQAQKNMNQAVIEYVKGIDVIKTFNMEDSSYAKYKNAVIRHAEYAINWMKSSQIYASLSYSIAPVSIFPTIVVGLIFFNNGFLTEQSLFLFMMISLGIFKPIVKASSYVDQLAQMGTVTKEIKGILDYPELKRSENSNVKEKMTYDIAFENLQFSYDGTKNDVDDVNLTIKEKTMTAIIGTSGSGKSTLMKLLAGFWDFEKGKIKIGGIEVKDLSMNDLNTLISYVDQNTFLFDDTILENIRIGKKDATNDEVIEAAKRAGCHDFIVTLPDGYDTIAGDRLSGGEKQRIAIARAILKNAPIIILDEATASTDIENEEKIQGALLEFTKGKTLIVITHKIKTVINADKIIYMENGKIICDGKHEELIKSCSTYKHLYEIAN
ncbi:ABC transporter ATP-binding protein/permease [Anaerococcus sp. NML200574]|uniref:ABC transporter ATP-binding protein n=1 Tax=Anaerococcus sp. NML200574 TaxID=2954486 RepID=UPI002237D3C7|nr:ABC transporter ATP-binding protein [Anaerococcus sp. NML200574]MCW6679393.1 ABC transporter ATP-binding protein/permease [Anaerococcus sp. NML200574]